MNWDAAVFQYNNLVRQVCYQYEKDPEELDDLMQEVWSRAYEKFEQFNGGSDFGTWLHAVAESVSRNSLRSKESRPEILYDVDRPEYATPVEDAEEYDETPDQNGFMASEVDNPEEWAQADQVADLIDAASDTTKLAWIVLHCQTMRGQTTREIASTLGIEESTVRTYLQRARDNIEALLEENQGVSAALN